MSKENHCKLYSPYKKVIQAKLRCYQPRMTITITESSAEFHLQALLDHTVKRILFLQKNVIRSLTQRYLSNMNFICSCDESYEQGEQSEYRQTFIDDSKSDANVLHFSCTNSFLSITNQRHKSFGRILSLRLLDSADRSFCTKTEDQESTRYNTSRNILSHLFLSKL